MNANQDIQVRVQRLESKFKRASWAIVALSFLLALSVVANTAAILRDHVVVARKVVIEDSTGQTRMTLGTNPDGRPLLLLQDANGRPGISMGYNLFDKPGVDVGMFGPRTRIGFSEAGQPSIAIQSDSGVALVEMGVGPDGTPGVRVAETQPEPKDGDTL